VAGVKPSKPIYHGVSKEWKYVPSGKTCVAATIRRVKREQEEAATTSNVQTITKQKAKGKT